MAHGRNGHGPGANLVNGYSVVRTATFETTSRLLAALINEELAQAFIVKDHSHLPHKLSLHICSQRKDAQDSNVSVFVGLDSNVPYNPLTMSLIGPLDPGDLLMPVAILHVMMRNGTAFKHEIETEEDPGVLFDTISPWFDNDGAVRRQIINELSNSGRNQGEWFRLASECSLGYRSLEVGSPLIDWERAIIRGHPSHPMHRTCLARPPLQPLDVEDLSSVLAPEILFLSLQRSDLTIIGPFEDTLKPLLEEMDVDIARVAPDQIIVPCLARQLPSIQKKLHNKATVLSSTELRVKSQASIRTVSLPSQLKFKYDLKFAFACDITSALRTITPWTSSVGPELSILLRRILPPGMWVVEEVAAVTGAQSDFDVAKHMSVLIRENVELRALSQGQCVVVAGALSERSVVGNVCHAERVFELTDLESKKDWLREYAAQLLECTLRPVLQYGVCLEAHGQNVLVRFDRRTKRLAGFAIRDFGGLKLHMPTLHQHGYDVKSSPPGSLILIDDLDEVYDLAHHTVFNTHLNHLIRALRLHRSGGWAIVREELANTLKPDENTNAKKLYTFLMRENIPVKCFLRMKMEGLYRDYIHQDAPNILLS